MQMVRDADGRVWIAQGDRIEMVDGAERRVFSARSDLALGTVVVIAVRGRHVYAGGDFGLARFDGRRFVTLRSAVHPFLSRTAGIVETSEGDLWLNTVAGVVHIARADVDHAFSHSSRPVKARVFDRDDGMPGVAQQDSSSQTAMEASDGRLWFVTRLGVAWIDPKRLSFNSLPPPVIIKSLVSGGRIYEATTPVRLPKGTSNLQIEYTAPSLSVPSRVRFRYQLEGVDDGWVDPGPRREAFYTGLRPGSYRFRLMAANDDGVWNRRGAALEFEIPPTFFQSWPFYLLCALLALALLWLGYSLRLRAVADRIRLRMAERVEERERIARELHDTLLQSVQSLTLRFQLAVQDLPEQIAARPALENAIDQADAVIAEGRDRVRDLRLLQDGSDLRAVMAELVERQAFREGVETNIRSMGTRRALDPLALDEVTRIVAEAIFNVRRHAHATRLDIEIDHSADLTIRVVDNGEGIDPQFVEKGRDGHFGLVGMRERARSLRGKLAVRRKAGGGTEVILSVPGAVAYKSGRGMFRRLWTSP